MSFSSFAGVRFTSQHFHPAPLSPSHPPGPPAPAPLPAPQKSEKISWLLTNCHVQINNFSQIWQKPLKHTQAKLAL